MTYLSHFFITQHKEKRAYLLLIVNIFIIDNFINTGIDIIHLLYP